MHTRLTLASRNWSHAGLLTMAAVGMAVLTIANTAQGNETTVRVDVIAALVDDLPLDAGDLATLIEAEPGQATIGDVGGASDEKGMQLLTRPRHLALNRRQHRVFGIKNRVGTRPKPPSGAVVLTAGELRPLFGPVPFSAYVRMI